MVPRNSEKASCHRERTLGQRSSSSSGKAGGTTELARSGVPVEPISVVCNAATLSTDDADTASWAVGRDMKGRELRVKVPGEDRWEQRSGCNLDGEEGVNKFFSISTWRRTVVRGPRAVYETRTGGVGVDPVLDGVQAQVPGVTCWCSLGGGGCATSSGEELMVVESGGLGRGWDRDGGSVQSRQKWRELFGARCRARQRIE